MERLTTGYGEQGYLVPEVCSSGYTKCQRSISSLILYIIWMIILLAHRDEGILLGTNGLLQQSLSHEGLVIAPEKGTHLFSI